MLGGVGADGLAGGGEERWRFREPGGDGLGERGGCKESDQAERFLHRVRSVENSVARQPSDAALRMELSSVYLTARLFV